MKAVALVQRRVVVAADAFAELVIGFLVFGTALQYTGAGAFFIDFAFTLCGRYRGGAAKVAIFSSGLLGSMSGSVISNVLTTGTMTIPAMKRTGFRPATAAAIEACASTGAVLAPPVMGATAFVMAEFLDLPYAQIALAATIPALLYFFALFMQIDCHAGRHAMVGLPPADLPRLGAVLREGWYFIFVIVLLVVLLLVMKRENWAPWLATALLLILTAFVYKPMLRVLDERKARIAKGLEDARQASIARENADMEAKRILDEANVTAANLQSATTHGRTLLGLHQPDKKGKSSLSPSAALSLWPQLERSGLRLGAPAVTANAHRQGGWLDVFMSGGQARDEGWTSFLSTGIRVPRSSAPVTPTHPDMVSQVVAQHGEDGAWTSISPVSRTSSTATGGVCRVGRSSWKRWTPRSRGLRGWR